MLMMSTALHKFVPSRTMWAWVTRATWLPTPMRLVLVLTPFVMPITWLIWRLWWWWPMTMMMAPASLTRLGSPWPLMRPAILLRRWWPISQPARLFVTLSLRHLSFRCPVCVLLKIIHPPNHCHLSASSAVEFPDETSEVPGKYVPFACLLPVMDHEPADPDVPSVVSYFQASCPVSRNDSPHQQNHPLPHCQLAALMWNLVPWKKLQVDADNVAENVPALVDVAVEKQMADETVQLE